MEKPQPKHRVRRAVAGEVDLLNALAARSEAHWGFDERHMEAFKRSYCLWREHVEEGHTLVLECDGEVRGFYCILPHDLGFELEHLYIEPRYIGQGLGKALWAHLKQHCAHSGIVELAIVCSAVVKDFYLKMGAQYLGQVESTIDKGTMIVRLAYRIPAENVGE